MFPVYPEMVNGNYSCGVRKLAERHWTFCVKKDGKVVQVGDTYKRYRDAVKAAREHFKSMGMWD